MFGAELQISVKFLRVETNLYLHTQREAKFLENQLALKNFAVQTKHVFLWITCILIMCFRTHFNIKVWVGGFPFVVICGKFHFCPPRFTPNPWSFFAYPKAVSAAGGNSNLSPIAC